MLIKSKKSGLPLLRGILILLLVTSLSFNKQQVLEAGFETLEHINSQDWGYSSLKALLGLPTIIELGDTPQDIAGGLARRFFSNVFPRLPAIIYSKLTGFPGRPELERIDIEINFLEYQKILDDRKRAINNNILTEPQEIKARIHYREHKIKADMRLKGDLADHWRAKKRMSFRVNLKGDTTVQGFKRFSVHSPGSRQHPYDQIYQEIVRNSGELSVQHNYVRVYVNGTPWGVMNLEEHMSKELLEKQKAKESLIIKFGDEQLWQYEMSKNVYSDYLLSDPKLFNSIYQENKYIEMPQLRSKYSYIAKKFLSGDLEEITDVDSLSRTALVTAIWNNFHTLSYTNARFYVNPYTLRLESITTDQGPYEKIRPGENPLRQVSGLFRVALTSSEGQLRFKENLETALRAYNNYQEIIEKYTRIFPSDYKLDASILAKNIEISTKNILPLEENGGTKTKNKQSVKTITAPTVEQAARMPKFVYVRHYDNGDLAIFNLLPIELELKDILYKGRSLKIGVQKIPPSYSKDGLLTVNTEITGYQDKAFEVVASYKKITKKTSNDYTHVAYTYNPLLEKTDIAKYSFIKQDSEGYKIERGIWEIPFPVVLDGNLFINSGTELVFHENSYLIIKGKLIAKGEKSKPVIFKPKSNSWKGLYVIEGRDNSLLEHVNITGTSALSDGILELTGGVTFYKSPVSIIDSVFNGTQAEDALNLVKSDFVLNNVTITNTVSDAFDSDFSNGRIIFSKFRNIEGDAVDFSGSDVLIEKSLFKGVRDKAISSGEGSRLNVNQCSLSDVGVGIASKDGSTTTINNIKMDHYDLYAAMTYVKKDMFGPSRLQINNSEIDIDNDVLSQTGTEMIVNGKIVDTIRLDVKKLYQNEVMRK